MSLLTLVGPCAVTWYNVTGGTALGKTEGDVTVTFTQDHAPIMYDQDGVSPVDGIITGVTMEVTTPLAQATVDIMQYLFAQATLTSVTGEDGKLSVLGGVGTEMYAGSAMLEIARYVDGSASTDPDDLLRILRAYPMPDFEWAYGKEAQRVTNIRWLAFPSQDTGDVGVYFRIGDDT